MALDAERHAVLLWSVLALVMTAVGALVTRHQRRMPTGKELAWWVGVGTSLAVVSLLAVRPAGGIAAAPWRALVPAPAVAALTLYFGASLAYLAQGGGRLGYEALIGRRFLLAKDSPVLSMVTSISLVGVLLAVAVVILSMGVLAGFEDDLERKIIGANAHLVVQHPRSLPFAFDETLVETLKKVPGVEATAPFVEAEVALASPNNYTLALLFGIDPERSPDVLDVLHQLTEGSLTPLAHDMRPLPPPPRTDGEFPPPAPVPHIVIGQEIANSLNVSVGERIRVISPLIETTTPFGVALPKSQDFRVAGIFLSKMYELDSRYAYVPLESARRFLELNAQDVTGLQVRVDDADRSDTVGALAVAALAKDGRPFAAVDWKGKNRTLFAALKLERVVAFVVLVLIVFVASFSIVNTLTMSVIERGKEIAILKAMGAPDESVMKVFLVQGLVVGGMGTLLGAGLALAGAFALTRFKLPIPHDVYYIDTLPVHVGVWDIVAVVLAALVIVWDFAVWPALKGARLKPVEGLRD